MDIDTWQLIAIGAITIVQIYGPDANLSLLMARIWDFLAIICKLLSNALDRISIQARLNYFTVVSAHGN
jgi:hypothetical protein